jgi:hypothetical protein
MASRMKKGRFYKSNPTQGDVHVNAPLTNISIAFIQNATNFVADQVFPNIPVSFQSDRYYTYDRAYFNKDEMAKRAEGTESAGSGYKIDNTPTYFADVWAFHHDISDQRRANSDTVLQPDMEATNLVTMKALIKREKTWVANYFVASKWTNDLSGVASGENNTTTFRQWSDANSTPIEDIRGIKSNILESTGFEPNTLVIGQRVFDKLIDHPDIVDRVKYGQTAGGPAMVDVQELIALFKIPRIFVMKAIENTAAEGATNVGAFIGGKKAWLGYAAPAPGLQTPTAGYTFSWTGMFGSANNGQRISRFRLERIKSDRVEIEMAYIQSLISADLGAFWDTIVA